MSGQSTNESIVAAALARNMADAKKFHDEELAAPLILLPLLFVVIGICHWVVRRRKAIAAKSEDAVVTVLASTIRAQRAISTKSARLRARAEERARVPR